MIHPINSKPHELSELVWLSNDSAQQMYGSSAIQANRRLSGAFKVGRQEQVGQVLKWANENGASIQPISSGRNWGYGSALPVSDDKPTYILDLSQLKRVVEFDDELGLITLEPGVTQNDLANWLKENGHDFMVPVTGAGPNCSLVGNAIERGYGITPYADHFAASTALSAYFVDGTRYCSSLYSLDGSERKTADKSFKW